MYSVTQKSYDINSLSHVFIAKHRHGSKHAMRNSNLVGKRYDVNFAKDKFEFETGATEFFNTSRGTL